MIQFLTTQPILWLESGFFQYILKPPVPMRRSSAIERLDAAQRIVYLQKVGETYERAYAALGDEGFFARGDARSMMRRPIMSSPSLSIEELSWNSEFQPIWNSDDARSELRSLGLDRKMSFKEKFELAAANGRCIARRYFRKSDEPRPVVIGLHGYAGGHFRAEEMMWPIQDTLDQGFDLVIMVLPHHGQRIELSRRYLPPRFPSRDIRFTIEALRQTCFDVAALHDWLRAEGSTHVGLAGVSLGAYCSALISTINKGFSFVLPLTPLGCMATLTHEQSRFIGTVAEQQEQREAFSYASHLVNPLKRRPLISPEQMVVIAGERDGITGIHHARLLASHFQCMLLTFPGGHIIRSGFRKAWTRGLKALPRMEAAGVMPGAE